MNRTAVRAYPFPYAEIPDFWIPAAAAMADLAGREELIYFDKLSAAFFQLVIQHEQEHPVTIIECCFSIPKTFIAVSYTHLTLPTNSLV